MAEINGLLNRHTVLKPYRGFESLPHRRLSSGASYYLLRLQSLQRYYGYGEMISRSI